MTEVCTVLAQPIMENSNGNIAKDFSSRARRRSRRKKEREQQKRFDDVQANAKVNDKQTVMIRKYHEGTKKNQLTNATELHSKNGRRDKHSNRLRKSSQRGDSIPFSLHDAHFTKGYNIHQELYAYGTLTRCVRGSSGGSFEASTASTASLTDSSVSVPFADTPSDKRIPQHVIVEDAGFTSKFKSQFVALDCEMVGIGEDSKRSALGRVSIVDWDGVPLFDKFVKVKETVTDLRTFVSGLTMDDIDGSKVEVTMEFEDCIEHVKKLLQGRTLVGHALKNDLRVLGVQHPWYDIRDTTKFESFQKVSEDGVRLPRKLKELAYEHLNHRCIQRDGAPHNSVEDAIAAMDLYKTVSKKWECTMEYKRIRTETIHMMTIQSTNACMESGNSSLRMN